MPVYAGRPTPTDPTVWARFADAEPTPFWLADLPPAEPAEPYAGESTADLVVVGAGFTGLWTALLAKESDPSADVVLLEAETVGWAASGRNGGFCAASVTHGFRNGLERWPDELSTLVDLGRRNLDGLEATLRRYDIDAQLERTGELTAAVEDWQVEHLREEPALAEPVGLKLEWLDADQAQAAVASPLYRGALLDRDGVALVHPGRLARGLLDACRSLGVRVHEGSPATALERWGTAVDVRTPAGTVRAARVVLATSAFKPLLARLAAYVVPVWDYVLVTEPLTPQQRASVGWTGRQGVGDAGNQFHYTRLTADDRILWGGYDAIYHYGGARGREKQLDRDPEAFARLADHFALTFPQLAEVRFSHAWGGAIDTCSRFSAFWGTAMEGRVAYVLGFTGLGVGASRFGAATALDLVHGRVTERTALSMVRTKPVPFPPEPVRYLGIEATRRSIDAADRNQGVRNLWLRALDRLGLGFDS